MTYAAWSAIRRFEPKARNKPVYLALYVLVEVSLLIIAALVILLNQVACFS